MIELPFYIGRKTKWISGINETTTCKDILVSILHTEGLICKDGETTDTGTREEEAHKQYALVEKWREVEKVLKPSTLILKIWRAWSDEANNVAFIVKRIRHREVKEDASVQRVRRRNSRSGKLQQRAVDTYHPRGIRRSHRQLQQDVHQILRNIITQGETVKQHLLRLQDGEENDKLQQLLDDIRQLSETRLRSPPPTELGENPETSNDSGVGGEDPETEPKSPSSRTGSESLYKTSNGVESFYKADRIPESLYKANTSMESLYKANNVMASQYKANNGVERLSKMDNGLVESLHRKAEDSFLDPPHYHQPPPHPRPPPHQGPEADDAADSSPAPRSAPLSEVPRNSNVFSKLTKPANQSLHCETRPTLSLLLQEEEEREQGKILHSLPGESTANNGKTSKADGGNITAEDIRIPASADLRKYSPRDVRQENLSAVYWSPATNKRAVNYTADDRRSEANESMSSCGKGNLTVEERNSTTTTAENRIPSAAEFRIPPSDNRTAKAEDVKTNVPRTDPNLSLTHEPDYVTADVSMDEPLLLPPPTDPSFYEWMDMFEKLHRLNRLLETKEEQVLALTYEFATLKSDKAEDRYLTPPPCFNTDVVKFREINARLMDEITRNGTFLSTMKLKKAEASRLVSQLEFDVNVVEKEGKRLEADLKTVRSMSIQDPTSDTGGTGSESRSVKCVRFSDTNTSEKPESGSGSCSDAKSFQSSSLKPKSILKSETSDTECSSDTGLSSLSVSSEEGTYSLTTLV